MEKDQSDLAPTDARASIFQHGPGKDFSRLSDSRLRQWDIQGPSKVSHAVVRDFDLVS